MAYERFSNCFRRCRNRDAGGRLARRRTRWRGSNLFTPFSIDEARAFWLEKVLPEVRGGRRRVVLARLDERIVGTVQLELEMPPNQQYRAAVAKLLVHPTAQRRGIGRALRGGTDLMSL